MSYIGNSPISAAFLTDTFSGTGSQTAFTMSIAPANTSSCLVVVSGVTQDPSTYSVSGTTLTFSAAPPNGTSNISVRYLGIPASGVTTTAYRTVTEFTATSGQTSFSTPSYTVGYIDVYRNGVRLVSTDFTATTGTTVVLNNGATVGDTITTISFYVSSVLNAIPATAGSVSTSYLVDGSVTQAKLSTNVAGNGPAFRGALATNLTVSNSTDTQISFNTEQFDTASAYSSGTFTVPVSGYYAVNCFIAWSGDITGYWNFYWKVNGSIAYTNAYQIQFTAAAHGVSGSDLLYLTAGQTLTSFVSQQSGSTKYVTAGGETFASIVLVRTA